MTTTINKYYNTRFLDATVVLELDYMLFLENESYEYKQNVLSFLDEVDQDTKSKVLIISNAHPDFSLGKYQEKWNAFMEGPHYESNILRAFRTFNELFLRVMAMKMVVISMTSKAFNPMLFNFSLAADLRCTSGDFYIDNNNHNMLNINKGGIVLSELTFAAHNPFKVLFLLDKVNPKTLYKRQVIDRIYDANLEDEVLKIADRLSIYEYFEFEVIKGITQRKLPKIESALQGENEFLMTCIRKKNNHEKL